MNPTQTPAQTEPDCFLNNMRALWRYDSSLALQVDAVRDEERFPITRTRSGAWTVQVEQPGGGGALYLHSRYDPEAESERFADGVELDEKFCVVVSGLGLGYHVRALFQRIKGDTLLICVEPRIEMIATALSCTDLVDLISSGRFVLLVDGDKARLHDRLMDRSTLMMLGTKFVHHPASVKTAPQAYAEVMDAINEFVTFTRMSLLTLVSNSKITCQNIAMNFVSYMSTPPIDMLRDRFAGQPAIVISAGPSLSRNIDQLEALRGKAVLCAVQTALQPLGQRGVTPDFVTSLDFHEISQRFFEGVDNLSQTHLVAEPKATWGVVDQYPGPVSLLDNQWARLVLGDALAARGGLKAGATVAHLAFYLAAYMGCDPIILVGQDLAYTGHVFYVPGVEIHQSWRSELNRFHSIEHKEWERIVRNRGILHRVQSVDGGELYTDELLMTYLEQFEKDISQVAARVIDATEGGARIRGTEVMSLAEATQRFCNRDIDPERFAYRGQARWRDPSRLAATAEELRTRIAELDAAAEVCDELLERLEELKGLTHDVNEFNRKLIHIDELRARVDQKSRAFQIVNAATQLAELRRFSADRHIGADDLEETQRALAQLDRDIDFVTGIRDGCGEVKPILEESLARVMKGMDVARTGAPSTIDVGVGMTRSEPRP